MINYPKVPISGHFHSSLIMPRLYDQLLVMVYADEAVQALLKGDLVNVTCIVNQNSTNTNSVHYKA